MIEMMFELVSLSYRPCVATVSSNRLYRVFSEIDLFCETNLDVAKGR